MNCSAQLNSISVGICSEEEDGCSEIDDDSAYAGCAVRSQVRVSRGTVNRVASH